MLYETYYLLSVSNCTEYNLSDNLAPYLYWICTWPWWVIRSWWNLFFSSLSTKQRQCFFLCIWKSTQMHVSRESFCKSTTPSCPLTLHWQHLLWPPLWTLCGMYCIPYNMSNFIRDCNVWSIIDIYKILITVANIEKRCHFMSNMYKNSSKSPSSFSNFNNLSFPKKTKQNELIYVPGSCLHGRVSLFLN